MNRSLWFAILTMVISTNIFAAGDPVRGQQLSITCTACHGADGNSTIPTYPNIAGQHESYIYKQLMEFKSGKRDNAIMKGITLGLTEQNMQDLGAYFAQQTLKTSQAADPAVIELGEALFRTGNAEANVPACMGCHGPNGKGNPEAKFPALTGQHAAYTLLQLQTFHSEARANDAGRMMRNVASRLRAEEMDALSQYLQGLR